MTGEQDKTRIDHLFEFIREIDKEKLIGRQTYISTGERKENDAEHAWHMAIMVLLLAEYSNEPIDVLRTVSMVLTHDLVEVYAGDTYAFDEAGKETQRQRELEAADKLFGILPEDMGEKFRGLWDEFEAWETPEAKFAHSVDNFQPLMLNAATGGKSWKEHGIRLEQVLKRNSTSQRGSKQLWEYAYANFIEPSVRSGAIISDQDL